jgi:Ca2+:H+ antiporter
MGETDEPPLSRSVKSKTTALRFGRKKDNPQPVLPTHQPTTTSNGGTTSDSTLTEKGSRDAGTAQADANNVALKKSSSSPTPAALSDGDASTTVGKAPMATRMKKGIFRFGNHTKRALLHSWVNVLLIFVPIGIAVYAADLSPVIVFSMNAVAIIPLAGLLAHATEAVAARLGDTLGALLNVSFGNAVELILFIILLAANQIEVVQAALLGSILANLLLILGMAFLLGGLRYQEQVYNSTVTQMSACMLSLAVMSLLLPTAFHAAFSNNAIADHETLLVSRGTSVVLLIVYILYLVFQLKSHTYMYASTPQHIIDEESHPGVLAEVWESSSDSSSSSSSSDSDSSAGSHTTAKSKIKRAVRRMRRKSSASFEKKSTPEAPSVMSSPSVEQHRSYFDMQRNVADENAIDSRPVSRRDGLGDVMSGDEADTDDRHAPIARDFEAGSAGSVHSPKLEKRKSSKKDKKKRRKHQEKKEESKQELEAIIVPQESERTTKVAFSEEVQQGEAASHVRRTNRPAFTLLSNNIFSNPQNPAPVGTPGPNIRVAAPRALRRTISEPNNLNSVQSQISTSGRPSPAARAPSAAPSVVPTEVEEGEEEPLMSRTAAVMLLVISTALVAVCADFLSGAIEPMVENTGVSQAFIGLIILPIVGNAAEHVTAVTVAMKNKMDLAIGIAVGSSIQIAIFITPFIVILGWIMAKPMTLYFNIFETVALFVTAFVVNFLVLDGRSNYLEGSLLIAAYVIIALSSFFYPDGCEASQIGGSPDCNGNSIAAVAPALMKRFMGM